MVRKNSKEDAMNTVSTEKVVVKSDKYERLLVSMDRMFGGQAGPFFRTSCKESLWNVYLNAFPEGDVRQYHNCHACKTFIETYGHLATIDPKGNISSAIWNGIGDAPGEYRDPVQQMAVAVGRSKVTGMFLSSDAIWGKPVTGLWTHFSVTPAAHSLFKDPLLNASQKEAEKREDFLNIFRALKEFSVLLLRQALSLLQTELLYRGEKVIGPVQWLYDLATLVKEERGRTRENLIWRAVAAAPAGFCHPRSSMAGSLLEDLTSELSTDQVLQRFEKKMNPIKYQRPQALPSKGNLEQAEKIVEKMGIAPSLNRRFARVDEVEALWVPRTVSMPKRKGDGVFSHLRTKEEAPVEDRTDLPIMMATWEKFSRTVLPDALEVSLLIPWGNNSFGALTTAVDPEAPPILQWDLEERRNPFAWYLWMDGSPASRWGLTVGSYCSLLAISFLPPAWGGNAEKFAHQGKGIILLLDGARESVINGNALFPECLKSELHAARSTLEAYSKNATIEGMEEGSACGLILQSGRTWDNIRLKVKTDITPCAEYQLDRWD
jgi:hypothetical protein